MEPPKSYVGKALSNKHILTILVVEFSETLITFMASLFFSFDL